MTKEEAIAALAQITHGDQEEAHSEADSILLRYVEPEVAQAWRDVSERCGGFWYA